MIYLDDKKVEDKKLIDVVLSAIDMFESYILYDGVEYEVRKTEDIIVLEEIE